MASDFDAIGVPLSSPEQFEQFVTLHSKRYPKTATPIGGSYIRAGGSDGAQVWIQTDPTGAPIGAHPHFAGSSRFRARVDRPLRPMRGTPLDGGLCCAMIDDQPGVPLVVDVPDFAMGAAWAKHGSQVILQIAAMPRAAQVYTDPEEFAQSPLAKLSSEGAFIPSGTFRPGGGAIEPPTNDAILTGRVVESVARVNDLTAGRYVSLMVATLGGRIDVVFAASQLPSVPPVGSIVAGSFVLSACVIEPKFEAPKSVIDAAANEARAMKQPSSSTQRPSLMARLLGRK